LHTPMERHPQPPPLPPLPPPSPLQPPTSRPATQEQLVILLALMARCAQLCDC
jgi:hypothetical protein